MLAKHMRCKAHGQHAAIRIQDSKHVMMLGGIERHAKGSIHIHMMLSNPPESASKAMKQLNLSNRIDL